MADAKLSALSAISAVALDDLFYVVDDPAGTPSSTKATTQQLQAAMGLVHTAGSDADTTLVVGAMHVFDVGAFTADRTATLPATAAVGDRCGIIVSTGDDTYELLITAASGDTLNGIAGGTEWSRVFITGEAVIFRCIAANATWVVEHDGRLPETFKALADGTNQQSLSTGVGTTVINGGGSGALRTLAWNVGGGFTQSSGIFFPRRPGRYLIGASGVIDLMNDGNYMAVYIGHSTDGSSWSDSDDKAGIAWRGASSASGLVIGGSGSIIVNANGSSDRWAMRIFHTNGGTPKVPGTASVRGWAMFWGEWLGDPAS